MSECANPMWIPLYAPVAISCNTAGQLAGRTYALAIVDVTVDVVSV